MNKIKVAVIFGSKSSEHEISCMSAGNILGAIDPNKYDVTQIGIDKEGTWFVYNGTIDSIKENKWIQDNENKEEIVNIIKKLKEFDIAFPVLHGKYGEDGTIQGMFEMNDIKYTGPSMISSALAMDKVYSKMMAGLSGVPIVPYYYLYTIEELYELMPELCYPLIVKPCRQGSSYGISIAHDQEELIENVKEAFKFDSKIIIENYIANKKELECSVIGNKDVYASTLGEIIPATEFYDFNAKYKSDKTQLLIPASIDDYLAKEIKDYAVKVYRALDIQGFSRVDFLYDVDNSDIYFSEINTIPGFTNISMFPKLLEYDGIKYSELVNRIITLGLER